MHHTSTFSFQKVSKAGKSFAILAIKKLVAFNFSEQPRLKSGYNPLICLCLQKPISTLKFLTSIFLK